MRSNSTQIPKQLIGRWWQVVFMFAAGISLMFLWLQSTPWGAEYALRWLVITTAVVLIELVLLRYHLDHNHPPDSTTLRLTFGWGNAMTLSRGLLLAMLAGLIGSPWPLGPMGWLPVILYTIAALFDGLDGYVARKTNHQTKLGATLDMEFDALGIGVVILLIVWYGQLPWWYLSLALARYLFVLGIWWRERQSLPIYDLSDSKYRRLVAGYQMGFLSVALWPIFPASGVTLAGVIFVAPMLALFLRDWLVVSGRIDATTPRYQQMRYQAQQLFIGWAPVLLRIALFVAAVQIGWLIPDLSGRPEWVGLFAYWGWPPALINLAAVALAIASPILIMCVVLGILGRWLALAALFTTATHYTAVATLDGLPSLSIAIALATTLIILITDSGYYSLYKPDDGYMYVPLGVNPNG